MWLAWPCRVNQRLILDCWAQRMYTTMDIGVVLAIEFTDCLDDLHRSSGRSGGIQVNQSIAVHGRSMAPENAANDWAPLMTITSVISSPRILLTKNLGVPVTPKLLP